VSRKGPDGIRRPRRDLSAPQRRHGEPRHWRRLLPWNLRNRVEAYDREAAERFARTRSLNDMFKTIYYPYPLAMEIWDATHFAVPGMSIAAHVISGSALLEWLR
jgi:hypothetical protein